MGLDNPQASESLRQLVLGRKEIVGDLGDEESELPPDLMTVNMGPSHPAMHGTVRIVLTVDGERVVKGDVQPGYLHRCFEKESEHATYTQVFPYTDRLNYVSPMINNVGWAMAVEKLMGLTTHIPKRAEYVRVIVSEMSRITDHVTCVGASAMELGAFTPFLYLLKAREWLYELLEKVSGARLTHTYVRVGGVGKDLPDNFHADLTTCLDQLEPVLVECEAMLNHNKIFRDRMAGIGAMTREAAIASGCVGPIGRACGVDYDVRKDYPYSIYPEVEFDVPLGTTGDCYDRYLVRIFEIKESVKILRQCLKQIPDGPIMCDDPRVSLPPKRDTYNTIESMIRHFKHIVDGIRVPAGEGYAFVEGGNGELGFFVVADGTGRPYKAYVRSPSFVHLSTATAIMKDHLIADIVPIFGMINMIGGECDKMSGDTVNLTIDGQAVSVPKGTNVLEAAKLLGVEISAFCYHAGLKVVAQCRQCLVTIEKNPKLQPSCQQTVAEGMVVHTTDAASTLARKQQLEFTLVNHPIDCPICDKAGECTLQKLYFDHDNADSRIDTPKVHKPKVVDLGPTIVLDQERCILCSRCIRVCDEVAGQHQLEFAHRGDHEVLGTAPGEQLDNPYSLNTVDVCPVGALTAKDFRFTMRAWELEATPSVCNGCATGCNIEIHHRNGRAWRLVPRHNPDVNQFWMCDEGRFTYHELREHRLAAATVDGLPAGWDRAVSAAAARLPPRHHASAPASVAVVLSAVASNEDNFALAWLAKEWGVTHVFVAAKPAVPSRADGKLRVADVNPNAAGVTAIAAALGLAIKPLAELTGADTRTVVMLGDALSDASGSVPPGRIAELEIIALSQSEAGVARNARIALPIAAWAETPATITNATGRVQRMHAAFPPPGQALAGWEAVVRLAHATNVKLGWTHARDVFKDMTQAVTAWRELQWTREARPLALRFAGSRG